jgi:hypothetical protein
VKVTPVVAGVTVYVPFAKPVNVKFPEASAVVMASEAPVRLIVAPDPVAVTVPLMLQVCVVTTMLKLFVAAAG